MVFSAATAPATPITRLKFDTSPSLAPSTAARSALPPIARCRPPRRASAPRHHDRPSRTLARAATVWQAVRRSPVLARTEATAGVADDDRPGGSRFSQRAGAGSAPARGLPLRGGGALELALHSQGT